MIAPAPQSSMIYASLGGLIDSPTTTNAQPARKNPVHGAQRPDTGFGEDQDAIAPFEPPVHQPSSHTAGLFLQSAIASPILPEDTGRLVRVLFGRTVEAVMHQNGIESSFHRTDPSFV